MSQLEDALAAANIKIKKFDGSKLKPITTHDKSYNADGFSKLLVEKLGASIVKYPEVFAATVSPDDMENMAQKLAEANGVDVNIKKPLTIPPDMKNLTLNFNLSSKGRDDKFFLTHDDETISRVSGEAFLMVHAMPPLEAINIARKVIPEYLPRGQRGIISAMNNGKPETLFNTYNPPLWRKYKGWKTLPDKLPRIFEELVNHLFPHSIEREYFYAWLHASLFSRAFVFLILCGAPGTGKNRLKLVLRALHGHANTTDGKKSTLTERFNSQLHESTLSWFDELHYDHDMENVMKELQNDSIAIERKGVDATRATRIHSSIVISNNKPRDNFIAFDARKFVPLVVRGTRLETSMKSPDIDALTQKVEDQAAPTFDVAFIAQIAKWVKKHGKSTRWPNLEYRGPMFWTLAHTSMTRWQKKAVTLILDHNAAKIGWDDTKKAYLWSTVHTKAVKKNGDRSLQFPDFTSVKAFFEVFRDGKGDKAFDTEAVPADIMGDFYVKPLLKNMQIITEASVSEQRSLANAKGSKKDYGI